MSHKFGVPEDLADAKINDLVEQLQSGNLNPDTIEVKIWWYEKLSTWIAANTRGFGTFVKAEMQPTNIKVETNPEAAWGHWFGEGRLDGVENTGKSVLGDDLPSPRIAVTRYINDTNPIDIIQIPAGPASVEVPPVEVPAVPAGPQFIGPVTDSTVIDPSVEVPMQLDFFDIFQ